jgi:hypothetical protein
VAGVGVARESEDLLGDLRIVPNPVRAGVPVRIMSAAQADLYDVLGRRISGTLPCGGRQDIVVSTSGLSPGIYFVKTRSGGARPAKVVVCK